MAVPISYTLGTKLAPASSVISIPATTATLISAAGPRISLAIFNNGSVTLFLGSTNAVTDSNGYPVPAGTSFTDSVSSDNWYGYVTTGPQSIRILSVS